MQNLQFWCSLQLGWLGVCLGCWGNGCVSEWVLPGPVAAPTKRCKSCFIYWFEIFFLLQTEMVTRQTPSRFIVCNAFIVMGYIQIAADWLKPPTLPLNERKCGPKSMLPKTCRLQLKKTKQKQGRKWQKCSWCGSIWHLLTLLRFLKKECNI